MKNSLSPREFAHLLEDYHHHIDTSMDKELPLVERKKNLAIAQAGKNFLIEQAHRVIQNILDSDDKASTSMQWVMASIQPKQPDE